jgi:hypothetical protein
LLLPALTLGLRKQCFLFIKKKVKREKSKPERSEGLRQKKESIFELSEKKKTKISSLKLRRSIGFPTIEN